MKTRTPLFAATALFATLAVASAAIAHPGMGRGTGQGNCQTQESGAQCPQGAGPTAEGHQGMGPGKGKVSGMGGDPDVSNLADVKIKLKITAEQEGAWAAYTTVLTQQSAARNNMRENMQARHADPQAPHPDRAAMQAAMQKFREALQTQRTAALKDLYAVLRPEQKALADQSLGGQSGMRGHGMGQGGGRMGHAVGHRMGGQGGMGMGSR